MTVSQKKKTGLITVTGILLLIAFALGFTVHPAVWDTRNVILTGLPYFIGCGAAAILLAVACRFLTARNVSRILLLVVCMLTAASAMFALTALWYDAVVEVAYIYGEGNLELGNAAAVRGSILLFAASALYLGACGCTVALGAGKRQA